MFTIQAFSVKPNVTFKQNMNKHSQPKFEQPYYSHKYVEREKNFSFLTGALCAATILAGVNQCSSGDRSFMLDHIEAEVRQADSYNGKSLKVFDATGDDVPDFVVEEKDGAQSIFDLKNNNCFYKDEFGIEKLY